MKNFLGIFAFLLFFSTAHSLNLSAPSGVNIAEKETSFPATIENNSSREHALSVSFFSPTVHRIENKPLTIKANSSAVIKIFLQQNNSLTGSYASTLSVRLGDETKSKSIALFFKESKQDIPATGFFSLANLFTSENLLNLFLAIIAAILLIAFIARYTKMVASK